MLTASVSAFNECDKSSAQLVHIIRSQPSRLSTFLSDHACHLFDQEAVLSAVIECLSVLSCNTVWQLHSHHMARIEAVMQQCPSHSPAAASFVQLLLNDTRDGEDRLTVAFCNSPFSSLILALLRLSVQPASTFPLYPLAPSSASSLLSALFFSAHPQSPTVRQHISVLLLLVRPPPLRQQLLSSLLLQCLSSTAFLLSLDLSSVLSFLCQRLSAPTFLASYMNALTTTTSSSTSFPLTSHRTFLNLFISPRHFTAAIGRLLFDFFASTLSSAIAQRQSALFSLVLQLARHCITNVHANGAAAATHHCDENGDWKLPRDYSAWFDEQFRWVRGEEDSEAGKGSKSGDKKVSSKRKRKEKYVLRKKPDGSLQQDLEEDLDEYGEESAEAEEAVVTDSATVRRQQRAEQDKRRKERQQQEEDDAQADKRHKQRQQEAAADRQERVRFVLARLFDSLSSDETAVVTHYLHHVNRYWKGEGLLSDAEAERYSRCARIKIGGGSWTEGDAIVLDASQ